MSAPPPVEPGGRRPDNEDIALLQAIEQLALGQELEYDVAAACAATGLPEDELRHIWRSLGFPDPPAGEVVFTEVDLTNLASVARLLHSGLVQPEVAYSMTRVVGSSMARIASALVDTVTARPAPSEGAGVPADLLPMFPQFLEQAWRRHLQVAARRRLLRDDAHGPGQVVGFADLVGFTALAQQVSDEELAEVVDQFEHLAYDVVVAGGGRVVKMIGDEVMFLVEDPVHAAEIALGLAEASRDAAGLSDVRVGMAVGPVLEREGDVFGTTVNLASRATAIAYPGTVVVSAELRATLADSPGLSFRAMRPRGLKNLGRVTLSVMRREADAPNSIRASIDERRQQMREVVREKLAARTTGGAG